MSFSLLIWENIIPRHIWMVLELVILDSVYSGISLAMVSGEHCRGYISPCYRSHDDCCSKGSEAEGHRRERGLRFPSVRLVPGSELEPSVGRVQVQGLYHSHHWWNSNL